MRCASREVAALQGGCRAHSMDIEEPEFDDERSDPSVLLEEVETEDEEDHHTDLPATAIEELLRHTGGAQRFTDAEVRKCNRENARLVHAEVQRLLRRGCTIGQAKARAKRLPLELEVTADDLEVAGRKVQRSTSGKARVLSMAHRSMISQVEVRPQVLLKTLRGSFTPRGGSKPSDAVKNVPKGLSIQELPELVDALGKLTGGTGVALIKVSGGKGDRFGPTNETLTIRVPPGPPPGGTRSPAYVIAAVAAITAPFHDARKSLRATAFHLRVAKLQAPSRQTQQSYWGHTANHAREGAIRSVAFGVPQGAHVEGINHPSLCYPTLVHSDYVRC